MTREAVSQVVVNGRFLARRVTGVERHGREILHHIESSVLSEVAGCRVELTRRQGLAGHAWEQFLLPTKLDGDSILWSPANTGPLSIRNQVLTIHDISPLEHPEWFRASFAAWYRLFLPMLARRVRKIFTPSEYVRQKVVRRFGIRNVIVTPNGVDHSVFHPHAKQTQFDLPENYVLFVGSLEPRKNLTALLQAWKAIKDDFKQLRLVIVGVKGHVFRSVDLPHDVERVRFLGYVDDGTLAGLYAKAMLFVLPSQEEGFGMPALEAMASGAPVIVSDGGALPEVVGGAGFIFNLECQSGPCGESRREAAEMIRRIGFGASKKNRFIQSAASQYDTNQLANALRECMGNARLRLSLKEKGLERARQFSWQRTAELVWRHLNEF